MKKLLFIITVLIIFLAPALYAGQDADYKNHPGYVDFGSFEKFKDANQTLEVFIKGPLLKFVAKASEAGDPEMGDFIRNLKLIKVDIFSVNELNMEDARNTLKSVSNKIDKNKWELMVRIKDKNENGEIYVQFGPDDSLNGLVMMMISNNEALFVNIVGTIDPSKLGKLSTQFNIPKLDKLEIEAKAHKGGRYEK